MSVTGESDRDRFWREVSEKMHADPPVPLLKGCAVVIPVGPPLAGGCYWPIEDAEDS